MYDLVTTKPITAVKADKAERDETTRAIDKGVEALLERRRPDGTWDGRVLGAATSTALYVLLKVRIGERDERFHRAVTWLVEQQNESGGWSDRRGLPDVPTITKTVAHALASALPEGHPALVAARRHLIVLAQPLGRAARPSERQEPIRFEPAVEGLMAFWGVIPPRRMQVPAPALWCLVNGAGKPLPRFVHIFGNLTILFQLLVAARSGSPSALNRVLTAKAVREVMEDRGDGGDFSGSWMGGAATTINALGGLAEAGCSMADPKLRESLGWVESWQREDGSLPLMVSQDTWETLIISHFLRESGRPTGDALARVGDFLMDSRRTDGTWWSWDSRLRDSPSGYGDWDDTSYGARLLVHLGRGELVRELPAALRQMQYRGGWTHCRRALPIGLGGYTNPVADVTSHVLIFLSELGGQEPLAAAAIAWLRRNQEPDGSWAGAWYARRTYGIQCAVEGLVRAGIPPTDPSIRRAITWLLDRQNADGGWGEDWEGRLVASSIEQTSYALHALAFGDVDPGSPAMRRALRFVLDRRNPDGLFTSSPHVGTFFERCMGGFNTEDYASAYALTALRAVETRAAGAKLVRA